jgi:hypothetical protein
MRKQLCGFLARRISELAALLYAATPSNRDERLAVVEYVRANIRKALSTATQDSVIRVVDTEIRMFKGVPGGGYEVKSSDEIESEMVKAVTKDNGKREQVVFQHETMLMASVLYCWRMCTDKDSEPPSQNTSASEDARMRFYDWEKLYKSLARKLQNAFDSIIRTKENKFDGQNMLTTSGKRRRRPTSTAASTVATTTTSPAATSHASEPTVTNVLQRVVSNNGSSSTLSVTSSSDSVSTLSQSEQDASELTDEDEQPRQRVRVDDVIVHDDNAPVVNKIEFHEEGKMNVSINEL